MATKPEIEKLRSPRAALKQITTEDERLGRAEQLRQNLMKLALEDGHKAMVVGQVFSDMHRQELWRYFAESWKEFVNDCGYGAGQEFMRRKNYEFYVQELGMDTSDPRLSETPESKLAIGTRNRFRAWVRENIDDFLDLARLPLGEGGLSRADLAKYIEEELGIGDDSGDSMTRRCMRSFRRAVVQYSALADDAKDVLAQAIRNDDDVFNNLAYIIDYAGKKQPVLAPEDMPDIEVDVDLDEEF